MSEREKGGEISFHISRSSGYQNSTKCITKKVKRSCCCCSLVVVVVPAVILGNLNLATDTHMI